MVGFFSPLCQEEHDVDVDGCFLLALGATWAHFYMFINMLYTDFSSLVHNSYVAPNFTIYGRAYTHKTVFFFVMPTTGFTELLGLQCPHW